MYVTAQEYEALSLTHAVPAEELESALQAAERDIDSLTFCRIHKRGLEGLTDFQRQNVKQAVVDQADFRAQYGELLDNPLASYSVNGVSMSWDKSKILRISDVDTSPAVYSLLRRTGLTYRGVP